MKNLNQFKLSIQNTCFFSATVWMVVINITVTNLSNTSVLKKNPFYYYIYHVYGFVLFSCNKFNITCLPDAIHLISLNRFMKFEQQYIYLFHSRKVMNYTAFPTGWSCQESCLNNESCMLLYKKDLFNHRKLSNNIFCLLWIEFRESWL